jgi:hypothetical protein
MTFWSRSEPPRRRQPFPISFWENSVAQDVVFPELIDAVAQAISHPAGSPFPAALKRAIAQFPDRVQATIDSLSQQQNRQQN